MRFAFTEEQQELRAVVRTVVDRSGGPVIRAPGEPPEFDRTAFGQLAEQVGVCGLAVPEELGGAGFGLVEALIVVEELGRRLVGVPFLSTVVATEALVTVGDRRLLPEIAEGSRIAVLAGLDRGTVTATRAGEQWSLSGRVGQVLDGPWADTVLVLATADDGPALFEVDADLITPTPPLDPSRPLGELSLDDARGTWLGLPNLQRIREVAATAVAAESIGAAQRWLHETVSYTQVRTQFGRPIGSFQALKHRLADAHVSVESARSLAYAASWAVAVGSEQAGELAAMAKSACCEAYSAVAAEGVQLHGGIGITWEHEAHLHLKRAHTNHHLHGTPAHHRATIPLG